MRRIGLLGGTFNPVHIGHIRPAIEAYEALLPERIDLIPCAEPPHKTDTGLLPFALREEMVRKAAAPFPFLHVNTLEKDRSGPSYTYDTLMQYRDAEPDSRLFFILGAGDFITLPKWYKGTELTDICDLLVLPRSGNNSDAFHSMVTEHWPQAVQSNAEEPLSARYRVPSGHDILFLPQPRLDISATMLRERWLQKKNISYLVPDNVLEVMESSRKSITECWNRQKT